MPFKIISQFNIPKHCRNYGLTLWQCPPFLFFIMGLIIIMTSIVSYLIGNRYIEEPAVVALIDMAVTTILLIIASVVTRNFERLAEISKMKSEFIGVIIHQLRSPLTNLKWTVELLADKDWQIDTEKEEEYYSNLKENISRMVELIDQLLIIPRIEEKSITVIKKETALEDIITELISRFKVYAEASNIQINFYPRENLPKVFTDPIQIKLVIENLIDNAVRYTRGGGKIDIRLEKRGDQIYFEIKDSGVGIPKVDQKYIFQKFFRSGNALKSQTRGIGLGLFIVKSIIENSGGKIWFLSEEGKGTTFCFTLPIK